MQDYRNIEPEELAIDPSFQRWKLINDPIESDFWKNWLAQNPDKEELIDKAYHLLSTLTEVYARFPTDQAPVSDREVKNEIQRLQLSIDEIEKPAVKWYRFTPWQYGIAAGIVLVLGFFLRYMVQQPAPKTGTTYRELITQVSKPLLEVANANNGPKTINLPDGSTIVLKPQGRVSYANDFGGEIREVYLVGEAFFEVHKDPSRPFYVYANGLVTKVLGTSFTVQAPEDASQVKVLVKTGKVSVFAGTQATVSQQKEDYKLGGIVLTPNQQIVFSPTDTRIIKSVVPKPAMLEGPAKYQLFSFKRTPIAEVFATLEKSYGIKIVYDEEVMKDCYLTASLDDEPLFEKLDLICNTISAHYEQMDAHIIITSKGCQL
ncbi:FecR family protein [Larkinella rosea]|uniref:FecR family protein n=1 Tax=Larkinella rosea TaxID=2025312 RepID=A0A3P1BV41_9BACT|nr:FecR family protein [Larkinella rosea]RRB04733.1 FecR family protein [Larkinella rosea]